MDLNAGSDNVGKICPYCQTLIGYDEMVTVCDRCRMPHHHDCWRENGGCTTFGCKSDTPNTPHLRVVRAQGTLPPSALFGYLNGGCSCLLYILITLIAGFLLLSEPTIFVFIVVILLIFREGLKD